MKRYTLMALTVGLLLAADAPKDNAPKKDNDAKKELKKFEGTWQVTAMEMDGNKAPDDEAKNHTVVIKGDKYTLKNQDNTISAGTIKVNPAKKPKTIDITPTEGDNQGKAMLGIYELEGDTQKVCFAPPDKERPTKFESDSGSGLMLISSKRAKP